MAIIIPYSYLMKTRISHSLAETQKIASDWLRHAAAAHSDAEQAFIAGLSGHLGAGKTAFTKAVARELGIVEEVTSPTFVIMKIYDIPAGGWPWSRLVHIDAYRLERPEELEALRFEELAADRHSLALVEWPENVGLGNLVDMQGLRFEIKAGAYHINTD
jgi:tRNA threonylcarbamoyl adenosine modification protein YjeE